MDEASDMKSFAPQLFVSDEPSNEWTIEQLAAYAVAQHRQIVEGEMSATLIYWRLGRALDFARRNFAHGQWERFLAACKIDSTRAAKARAIFRTFDCEDNVRGLTVEEAYGQRQTKRARSCQTNRNQNSSEPSLDRFALGVFKEAESLVDVAAFMEPEKALAVVCQLDQAIESLQRLRELLLLQAKASSTIASGASGEQELLNYESANNSAATLSIAGYEDEN